MLHNIMKALWFTRTYCPPQSGYGLLTLSMVGVGIQTRLIWAVDLLYTRVWLRETRGAGGGGRGGGGNDIRQNTTLGLHDKVFFEQFVRFHLLLRERRREYYDLR